MHVKKCSKCLINKSINGFYMRKRGPRSGEIYEKCKMCMKIRGIDYYHKNHTRQLALANKRRRKAYLLKRVFIIKAKNKQCADCKKKYPFYVMDFDHRDYKTKTKNVSYMFTRNWSLDKIKQEIKKCDVVCANCHRIRTYFKLNHKYAEVAKVVTAGL
jgi:hypothetical protein